jgi:hypothetical protein
MHTRTSRRLVCQVLILLLDTLIDVIICFSESLGKSHCSIRILMLPFILRNLRLYFDVGEELGATEGVVAVGTTALR